MDTRWTVLLTVLTVTRGDSSWSSSYRYYSDGGYAADEGYMSDGYPSDWSVRSQQGAGWPESGGRSQCVAIPANMTLCRDIGYQNMRLPNLLEHDSLQEVTQQSGSWVPLLGIHCHENTKLFLCSLFSPVCLDRPIWPCRTLCEAVKRGCEGRMLKYGFPWPEMLRCDKFPPDNDLCIGVQKSKQHKTETKVCAACKKPDTFEGVVESYCEAEFVLRIKLKKNVIVGQDTKLKGGRRKKVFKKGSLTKRELRRLTFFITDGAACECPRLESARRAPALLVMGRRQQGRLVLSFLQQTQGKQHKVLRRALRRLVTRGAHLCRGGAGIVAEGADIRREIESPSYKHKPTNRKKQQRDRRRRKRRGGKKKQ